MKKPLKSWSLGAMYFFAISIQVLLEPNNLSSLCSIPTKNNNQR